MDAGHITDTILHGAEVAVAGLSSAAFINVIYWIEVLLCFFVPSTSGLAVLAMPILVPVADFAGGGRNLGVTSYQSGRKSVVQGESVSVMVDIGGRGTIKKTKTDTQNNMINQH